MRACEIQSFGLDGLATVDRPAPQLGPGQVLVQLKCASLNYRDYLTLIGQYNPRLRLPVVPLSDGAGVVIETGPDVDDWRAGDRVAGLFAQDWLGGRPSIQQVRTTLGGPLDGCLMERRVFPRHGLVRIPDWMSFEEASTLPCAALTAWSALSQAGTRAGDTVVVLGTGGVSIFALQFAKLLGARVIITSSSDEKLERARGLGADHCINYREKSNWSKEVRRVTAMTGADHVIEVGGTGTLDQSIFATRLFGHISLIGVLAGGKSEVNMVPVLMQNITVQGVLVGSREGFEDMLRAIDFHRMRPVIDRVFDFSEAAQAFSYLAAGKHFGKVCVRLPE